MFHYVLFLGKICNALNTSSDTVIKMEDTRNAPNEVRTVELESTLQFKFTYPRQRSYDSFFLFRPNETYIFKIDNNQTHSCLEYERNNVELLEDAVKELKDMDPVDLAKMHIEYRKQVETGETGGRDFSEQDIAELKGIVGGEENYTNMIQWAQGALNETEVNMFDAVMAKGDPLAAFFAVRSLAYAYNDSTGFEGEIVQGKAPRQSNDQFRSQQELIEAMSDKRYETDSAYRKDIMSKLERSPNVKF